MKVIAINGSPRKNGNTVNLLEKALEGAASKNAETEIIHLYDLNFKGCISCFECKRLDGQSYGKCPVNDDLLGVLEKIESADAFILGSPFYFGEVSGEMRCFLERLFFQYHVYDKERSVLTPKEIKTGFIFTMNAPDTMIQEIGYEKKIKAYEKILQHFFGSSKSFTVTDTVQFDDYSKYMATGFNAEAKAERMEMVFPIDCEQVYEFGEELVDFPVS